MLMLVYDCCHPEPFGRHSDPERSEGEESPAQGKLREGSRMSDPSGTFRFPQDDLALDAVILSFCPKAIVSSGPRSHKESWRRRPSTRAGHPVCWRRENHFRR